MKITLFAVLAVFSLSGCVTRPYYGRSVVEKGGQFVCGLHGVLVKAHEGYLFNGLIHFVDDESRTFASDRFPNTLVATFSEKKLEDYSLSYTDYTCPKCEAGSERLDRLPMWYKRIVGVPASLRRELQLKRAAAKAQRTGNPDDARVPDRDGYLSRVR